MRKLHNMKFHNGCKLLSLVLAIMICISMIPLNTFAVTPVSISNENGSRVVSSDVKTGISVKVKTASDTVELFKIGAINYNTDTATWERPMWTIPMGKLVAASEFAAYSTPELLGAEPSKAIQSNFLIYTYAHAKDEGTQIAQIEQNVSIQTVNAGTPDEAYYFKATNLQPGIYMLVATSNGIQYSPIVINCLPEQEAPDGNWFIKSEYEGVLKFSAVGVDKWMRVNDASPVKNETVKIGDAVSFDIYCDVPSYTNKNENGEMLWKDPPNEDEPDFTGFWFNLDDQMADAFTMDVSTLKVYTTNTVSTGANTYMDNATLPEDVNTTGTTYTELENTYYTALWAKAAAGKGEVGLVSFTPDVGDWLAVANVTDKGAKKADYYAYNPNSKTIIPVANNLTFTQVDKIDNTNGLLDLYKSATGNANLSKYTFVADSTQWPNITGISFNYQKLFDDKIVKILVTYDTVINTKIEVGTNNNTNTASFYYMKDEAGTPDHSDDTVVVWTYGVNVTKVNGDDMNEYLSGANFQLYKEAYTYLPIFAEGGAPSSSNYERYAFKQDIFGNTDVPVIHLEADGENPEADVTIANLADVEAEARLDFYYRIVNFEEGEACGFADCSYNLGKHCHLVAYENIDFYIPNADGEVEAVKTLVTNKANGSDGVTAIGLEPAKYVMIETAPPSGYNVLTEAIAFEITEFTDAQSITYQGNEEGDVYEDNKDYTGGSKKGFFSEIYGIEKKGKENITEIAADSQYAYLYKDGVYPIVVKNYKGLKLPSTGGMGTMIFTLIGIVTMLLVMIILIAKRRKNDFTTQF